MRLKSHLPWATFAFGVLSAFFMDRGPRRAKAIAIAVLIGWLLQIALLLFQRIDPARLKGRWPTLAKLAHFSSFSIAQAVIQQALFFSLPFYGRAFAGTAGQLAFMGGLSMLATATLWDPLAQKLLRSPSTAAPLQAAAGFAGLNAVLPTLGLSNEQSLWTSALSSAAGVIVHGAVASPAGMRLKGISRAVMAALLLMLLLLTRAGRGVVPPAPLKLTGIEIGTALENRDPVGVAEEIEGPSQLVCWSAIKAPRGLRDRVVHVWTHDLRETDRVEVRVKGGPGPGFRTWSVKQHLGANPEGLWGCRAETESGQLLGDVYVRVKRPPPKSALPDSPPKSGASR